MSKNVKILIAFSLIFLISIISIVSFVVVKYVYNNPANTPELTYEQDQKLRQNDIVFKVQKPKVTKTAIGLIMKDGSNSPIASYTTSTFKEVTATYDGLTEFYANFQGFRDHKKLDNFLIWTDLTQVENKIVRNSLYTYDLNSSELKVEENNNTPFDGDYVPATDDPCATGGCILGTAVDRALVYFKDNYVAKYPNNFYIIENLEIDVNDIKAYKIDDESSADTYIEANNLFW